MAYAKVLQSPTQDSGNTDIVDSLHALRLPGTTTVECLVSPLSKEFVSLLANGMSANLCTPPTLGNESTLDKLADHKFASALADFLPSIRNAESSQFTPRMLEFTKAYVASHPGEPSPLANAIIQWASVPSSSDELLQEFLSRGYVLHPTSAPNDSSFIAMISNQTAPTLGENITARLSSPPNFTNAHVVRVNVPGRTEIALLQPSHLVINDAGVTLAQEQFQTMLPPESTTWHAPNADDVEKIATSQFAAVRSAINTLAANKGHSGPQVVQGEDIGVLGQAASIADSRFAIPYYLSKSLPYLSLNADNVPEFTGPDAILKQTANELLATIRKTIPKDERETLDVQLRNLIETYKQTRNLDDKMQLTSAVVGDVLNHIEEKDLQQIQAAFGAIVAKKLNELAAPRNPRKR